MWQCISPRCSGSGAPRTSSSSGNDSAACTPVSTPLSVMALPSSPLAPLYFNCSTCSLRMVPCECCHLLVAADREVDGVLLCNRCGFLTILDPKLRALVQIPPFSRAILTCVTPSFSELERLKGQWGEWETRLRAAQLRTLSEGNAEVASPALSTPTQKKRRRGAGEEQITTMSEPVLPSTPTGINTTGTVSPGRSSSSMPPKLKAEGKKLQSEIHTIKRQWQRLLDDAATGFTTVQELPSMQHPMFSSTHLNILRSMYEKAMDKAELNELVAQIEQFLLQQSMIVKTKYDLLEGIRASQQIQELHTIALAANTSGGSSTAPPPQAATLMIHCSKEQVRHLQASFDKTARCYLKLVGVANKHLFALYNAAQSLRKTQETLDEQAMERSLGNSGGSCGGGLSPGSYNSSSPSLMRFPEHTRKRRMFGSATASATSSSKVYSTTTSTATAPVSGSGAGGASRVQQVIEMRHRLSEIAKTVDVWRSLSFTVASCCVLNLIELAQTDSTHTSART